MTEIPEPAARRAERLVRCYPRAWRARYGAEFVQLLIDEMSERPRSLARTVDILRSAALARLAYAGIAGDALEPREQVRVGLGAVGVAASSFLAAGVAIWSQLTIGWQWSAPAAAATKAGMLTMTATMLAFALGAGLAATPLLWVVGRECARGRGRRLVVPQMVVAAGGVVLVVGSIHFGHGWPGTGGHPWSGRDVVPESVARFCWAATLWVTSYWAHPGALASFPAPEVAWMIVSPLALVAIVAGVAVTLRRLPLSASVFQYEARLGMATAVVMAGFLAGACSWVISGGPAPRGLFRVGVIDSFALVVMSVCLIVGFGTAQRTLAASTRAAAMG